MKGLTLLANSKVMTYDTFFEQPLHLWSILRDLGVNQFLTLQKDLYTSKNSDEANIVGLDYREEKIIHTLLFLLIALCYYNCSMLSVYCNCENNVFFGL